MTVFVEAALQVTSTSSELPSAAIHPQEDGLITIVREKEENRSAVRRCTSALLTITRDVHPLLKRIEAYLGLFLIILSFFMGWV